MPCLVYGLDQFEHAVDEQRREAHGRLVHHDDARARHQGARHRDHLLLAAGKRAGRLAGAFGEAREQRHHARVVLRDLGLVVTRVGAHQHILTHRHGAEQAPRLRHRAEPAPDDLRRRQAGDRLAVEDHFAGAWLQQAEDHLHGGGLAAGIAAEQADDLPAADLDRKIVVDLDRPVERVDAIELEDRVHGAASAGACARPTSREPR